MATTNAVMGLMTQGQGRMYDRHELKLLNFSIVLYLCLGVLLFDSLGEFQELKKQDDNNNVNLGELRLNSVRRMWNITNQLNILYESNWTLLVLDELVEFERRFLETLLDNRMSIEESSRQKEDKDKRNSKAARSRSIKKSLIHSLATITTIGSPYGSPNSQEGKLVTMLYGALGIPLLFYTVSQTGKQLAHSSLNILLILRHYCFSLPVHYLCCSCNPYLCLRWLSWCCCCCCCSYLCCLSGKNKTKCCNDKGAPKLKLGSTSIQRQTRGGATGAVYRQPIQTAYVIDVNNRQQQDFTRSNIKLNNQQKSVRFVGQNQANADYSEFSPDCANQQEDLQQSDNGYLYSSGLFITSLTILGLYLSLGAYTYSRSQNTSLVDALYACFSMLSTSKLPDSFNLDLWKNDPIGLYESLKMNATTNKVPQQQQQTDASVFIVDSNSIEIFIWHSLYLICGLNLISMCGHFARLWLCGGDEGKDNEKLIERSLDGCLVSNLPNGHIPSIMGSLESSTPFADLQQACETTTNQQHQSASQILATKGEQYVMQTGMPAITGQIQHLGQAVTDVSNTVQNQQQQVNLADLFVVSQQTSPVEMIQYGHRQQTQQTSDVSFASDRSTDRGSLCLHHQAQIPGSQTPTSANTLYGTSSLYNHHHQPQMSQLAHQLPSQQHLYLATIGNQQQHQGRLEDEGEIDDDDNEMDRMLKTCIDGKFRSSNSSSNLHLSQSSSNGHHRSGSNSMMSNNGFGHQTTLTRASVAAAARLRSMDTNNNGCEQDSSLNTIDTTSGNTMSSISSRIVKIPQHMHIPNGIGFILDGDNGNNKQ